MAAPVSCGSAMKSEHSIMPCSREFPLYLVTSSGRVDSKQGLVV